MRMIQYAGPPSYTNCTKSPLHWCRLCACVTGSHPFIAGGMIPGPAVTSNRPKAADVRPDAAKRAGILSPSGLQASCPAHCRPRSCILRFADASDCASASEAKMGMVAGGGWTHWRAKLVERAWLAVCREAVGGGRRDTLSESRQWVSHTSAPGVPTSDRDASISWCTACRPGPRIVLRRDAG